MINSRSRNFFVFVLLISSNFVWAKPTASTYGVREKNKDTVQIQEKSLTNNNPYHQWGDAAQLKNACIGGVIGGTVMGIITVLVGYFIDVQPGQMKVHLLISTAMGVAGGGIIGAAHGLSPEEQEKFNKKLKKWANRVERQSKR